jgi:uncharacterized protein (TIRG00374 family)
MVSKKIRDLISLFLRIFFSFLILFFIFKKIEIRNLFEGLKKMNYFYFFISFIFYWVTLFFLSYRWKILLIPFLKKSVSIFEIFKVYMLGMLINTITPATAGVDISRGIILSKYTNGYSRGFASVVVDRITGMIGIFLIAFIFLIFSIKGKGNLFALILIFLFLSIFSLFLFYIPFVKTIFEKIKIFNKLLNFYNAINSYKRSFKLVLYSTFLAIPVQISFSLIAFFVAKSFGMNGKINLFIVYVPIINALNVIPFTISGFGIREGAFLIFFKDYFLKEKIILVSIFYWFVSAIGNLPALYYLFKNPFKEEK